MFDVNGKYTRHSIEHTGEEGMHYKFLNFVTISVHKFQ
jgi:hypothetical protein